MDTGNGKTVIRSNSHWVKRTAGALLGVLGMLASLMAISANSLYSVTDLGDLEGGKDFSDAFAVNESGQVVGIGSVEPGTWGGTRHAFLWDSRSGMQDLGTLAGPGYESIAEDVNNRGEVVGWSTCPLNLLNGNPCGFLWNPTRSNMTWVGEVPGVGPIRNVRAISENGNMAGWAGGGSGIRAVFIDGKGSINLGDSVVSEAWGLSENKMVVGSEGPEAIVWDLKKQSYMSFGGAIPTTSARAIDINDRGQVLLQSNSPARGYLWSAKDGVIDIGELQPGSTRLYALNSRGMVVGESNGRAFLWTEDDGMLDLNDLIHPSTPLPANMVLVRARDINNKGQIACQGEVLGLADTRHAILLTPTNGKNVKRH